MNEWMLDVLKSRSGKKSPIHALAQEALGCYPSILEGIRNGRRTAVLLAITPDMCGPSTGVELTNAVNQALCFGDRVILTGTPCFSS